MGSAKSWLLSIVPFVAIAMLFALAYAATMAWLGAGERQNRRFLEDMLTSIDLVQRMGHDIDQVRLLAGEHIHSKEPAHMADIESQLGELENDLTSAANEFTPLARLPGEGSQWEQLKESIGRFEMAVGAGQGALRTTLDLSRANRDVEAAQSVQELDARLSDVEGRIGRLVELNRAHVAQTLDEVRRRHHTAVRRVQLLAIAGMAMSLVIGVLTARLLRERQARLHRYSAALEAKNRELDAFAGRVAHDLRGPVNTMSLETASLGRRWPEAEQATAKLHRAVERIGSLIGDLLSLSRLSTAEVHTACDPARAAAQVRDDLVPRLQEQGVAVRVDVQPASVQCSEPLLRQVLWNLVENSAKYRRREVESEVEIHGRRIKGRYALSVRDNGLGMSPDEVDHAFEPLFRGQGAREQPGSGLGLSIVKRVVDASGGTITIDSHPGEGTTLCALLPLANGARRSGREVKTTP
jgi:signal transduction histidine kinase